MLNGLVRGIAMKAGLGIVTREVRAAAEGKRGERWKAVYWGLAGWKTWSGLALALVAVAAVAVGQDAIAVGAGSVAGVALSLGLVDKSWRTEIPRALRESSIYLFLVRYTSEVAVLLATLLYLANEGWCGYFDCGRLQLAYLGIGAIAVQLGILDAGWKSTPPIVHVAGNVFEVQIGPTKITGSKEQLEKFWRERLGRR